MSAAIAELRAVASDMVRFMPAACGDWAARISAAVDEIHDTASLRDQFAGQAMAGLLASNAMYRGKTDDRAALAGDAYATADAMLAARGDA